MPASPSHPEVMNAIGADQQKRTARFKLLLVLLICAAPMIASYFTYYVIRPETRNNYGDLIEPQRPLPSPPLTLKTLDGRPFDLASLKGKWVMLTTHAAHCDEACVTRLFFMRQLRVLANKDRDRIERVWLVTDDQPLSTEIMRAYDGTWMLRADPTQLQAWLPKPDVGDSGIDDHIYMVDPLGNLMMRFPKNADPAKVKKDLGNLLKASAVG